MFNEFFRKIRPRNGQTNVRAAGEKEYGRPSRTTKDLNVVYLFPMRAKGWVVYLALVKAFNG